MPTLTMKKNDLEPSFTATLQNADGTPQDLTNAVSVSLIVKATVGAKTFKAAGVFVNRAAGTVKYPFALGDTDTVGIYNAEWEVIWPSSRPQTTPNSGYFTFVVEQDLG